MSIAVPRWRFTESMIQDAPEWKGVYVLWSGSKPVGVGRASGGRETIRSRLFEHYLRDPASVTHYSWEICRNPAQRAAQLAQELVECPASAS